MKLLILGGTGFLGRFLVEAALARRHEVTLFNRGIHHPELFPDLEKLRGDRDGGIEVLRGQSWDAVLDTSGLIPRTVQASAKLLADQVERYVFVSTLSVYSDLTQEGLDESAPVATLKDENGEKVSAESFGPFKALCERWVEKAFPGRALIIRAGLMVGPTDPTDRFTYWPRRVALAGEVLAPMPASRQVQFVDVRDLSQWIVQMVETVQTGIFNATGPELPLTMQGLLEACRLITDSDAEFVWVGEEFLLSQGVVPFVELPLWVPSTAVGMMSANCSRALRRGLTFRPLVDTVRDILRWDVTRPEQVKRAAGLHSTKEMALLRSWKRGTWTRAR